MHKICGCRSIIGESPSTKTLTSCGAAGREMAPRSDTKRNPGKGPSTANFGQARNSRWADDILTPTVSVGVRILCPLESQACRWLVRLRPTKAPRGDARDKVDVGLAVGVRLALAGKLTSAFAAFPHGSPWWRASWWCLRDEVRWMGAKSQNAGGLPPALGGSGNTTTSDFIPHAATCARRWLSACSSRNRKKLNLKRKPF